MFTKVFNKIVTTLAKFHQVVCCDFNTALMYVGACYVHILKTPLVAAIVMAKELNENTVNDFLLGKTDEHEGTLDVSNSADGQNNLKIHGAGHAGKTSTDGTVSQSKPMASNTLHGQPVGTAKAAQPKAPLVYQAQVHHKILLVPIHSHHQINHNLDLFLTYLKFSVFLQQQCSAQQLVKWEIQGSPIALVHRCIDGNRASASCSQQLVGPRWNRGTRHTSSISWF